MAKRGRKKKKAKANLNMLVIGMMIASVVLAILIYNNSGAIGESLSPLLGGLMGRIKNFLPIGLFLLAVCMGIQNDKTEGIKIIQFLLILLCVSIIFNVVAMNKNIIITGEGHDMQDIVKQSFELGRRGMGGGAIGAIFASILTGMVGRFCTVVISLGIILALLVSIFSIDVVDHMTNVADAAGEIKDAQRRRREQESARRRAEREAMYKETKKEQRERERREREQRDLDIEQLRLKLNDKIQEQETDTGVFGPKEKKRLFGIQKEDNIEDEEVEEEIAQVEEVKKNDRKSKREEVKAEPANDSLFVEKEKEAEETKTQEVLQLEHAMMVEDENYVFPPLELLAEGKQSSRSSQKQLEATALKLQKTLHSFGVSAKVEDISIGPAITRYELKPAEGVRVSKIANLADDIALNLEAETIRIEAPIPGKHAVGIEVPNKESQIVPIRDILESDDFQHGKAKLPFALGKDVAGKDMVTDIAKFPHVMIAGATGSGKSVCINTLITSIIYKAKPSEVKMIMIDPKIVELSVYNGIPHLLIPVVTDSRKAAGALAWAVQEMENRYAMFAQKGVRDLKGYNEKIQEEENQFGRLPHIVIIVDELADLMMVAKNDVEDAICRLAQKARAAGMHLVIATQRPSVDVITGLIKANIPSRIAFAVSSQVDSRTILDQIGAEKLLGKGDMLFFPTGYPKPVRIQGAFVSDGEVESIVNFIKDAEGGEVVYRQDIQDYIENKNNDSDDDVKDMNNSEEDEIDPLLNEAIELVVDTQQASTSFIQRKFKVGYARAGRIIDQMEERGIISGYQGSKPREVLMPKERYQELKMQTSEKQTEE